MISRVILRSVAPSDPINRMCDCPLSPRAFRRTFCPDATISAANPATADSPATIVGSLPRGFPNKCIVGATKLSGIVIKSEASSSIIFQARGEGFPQESPARMLNVSVVDLTSKDRRIFIDVRPQYSVSFKEVVLHGRAQNWVNVWLTPHYYRRISPEQSDYTSVRERIRQQLFSGYGWPM